MTINLGLTRRWANRPDGAVERAAKALARRGKKVRPIRAVERVDRSPMNAKQWCLQLECGHEIWLTAAIRPRRTRIRCEKCEAT